MAFVSIKNKQNGIKCSQYGRKRYYLRNDTKCDVQNYGNVQKKMNFYTVLLIPLLTTMCVSLKNVKRFHPGCLCMEGINYA